jgi:hypothetical protein
MTIRRAFLCLIIALVFQRAHAQAFISVSGRLDDAAPRLAYPFDGLRGDVISVRLSVTSGDLDPLLTILDSSGAILAQRDDDPGGGRDLALESLRLPTSSRYTVIVSRFGGSLGTTAGDFRLTVERIGVSSASGSALRYGDSVYNEITDADPIIYYSFRGRAGDVITVQMRRATGDLDASLQLLNSRAEVVAENDDSPGSVDAAINGLILRQDDTYVIAATRYGGAAGRSRGAFVLTLDAASESGLGSRVDLAIPITPDVPLRGTISADYHQRFYAFTGQRGQTANISLTRAGGDLDAFVALLTPDGRELVSDDDSGGGQNALIGGYTLPADGLYLILATRYQQDAGTTAGDFTLTLSLR